MLTANRKRVQLTVRLAFGLVDEVVALKAPTEQIFSAACTKALAPSKEEFLSTQLLLQRRRGNLLGRLCLL